MAGLLFPQAKKEMLAIAQILQESDLDWTLARFMAPQNTCYTGNVKVGFGDTKMNFSISREDIGAFMIKMLDSDAYIHSMPIMGS
ncbi:MAG: NAD(P)H-binding protein [Pseudoflavonifractor capillosus]|uniref:NAD(P)H-binding protein n=1 Tax=Pseudoflavonifractor capillosus TaxID=106588 RepID=UPI0023F95BB9|nr:NAD(P)H-binding protein [Pseudoflavonifractor capillosus]MCI5927742.1 NAD(P)H-binding protein [Pseudoflavonifractor capillosus]MDY4662352.1 NAD(P)H-binding protein [Pseudoflavonifractor capillosus]